MFTLICCSLAGLKMSLRTGFCCRNFLAQDKIKVRRKLYLSLPHIGILGVPSPNCMLRLQFWDGALLPPAVLGWHLLTCNILPPDLRWHLLTSNILPPDVRWHLLTCNILPADLRWHLLTCKILPPDVRWHLLTCKFFTCSIGMAPSHLQYCTARFAMAPSHLQYFTARFAMAPSHLQYFTCRFAMAPSHLQYFTARFAMAPSHLENVFYRQICDGTFSPWKCFLQADLRWHLLTLKMFFTGRFAIAPSHLKKSFYRQSCNGIFSPWNFFPADLARRLLTCKFFLLQIWHGTFQGCQMHRKTKMIKPKFKSKLKSSKQP